MSRPTPRRPASSRGSTPRPRKIAGQAGVARPEEVEETAPVDVVESAPATAVRSEKPARTSPAKTSSARTSSAKVTVSKVSTTPDGRPGVLARQKTTQVLIATLALVGIASAAQFGILLREELTDDDTRPAPSDGQLTVPDGLPVVADELAVLDGVEQAAKAAQEIVAIDYESYGDEVAKASELMTSQFEEQYRTTADDIEDEFVANKTRVEANVVAQGVVRANRTRLEALVFLNQVVSRERDGEPETVVTPYKVLVTMVHTDQGWLVDNLDTDQQADNSN